MEKDVESNWTALRALALVVPVEIEITAEWRADDNTRHMLRQVRERGVCALLRLEKMKDDAKFLPVC